MKKYSKLFTAFFLASIVLAGCDEDNPLGGEGEAELEQQLGEFLVNAEANANEIYQLVDEALRDSTFRANDSATVNGAQVSYDAVTNTATIDFGNGVSGSDGATRKGIINLHLTGSDYLIQGSKVDGSFTGYKIDDVPVTGTFSIENMGNNIYDANFSNVSFNPDFHMNSNKSIEWLTGFSTAQDRTDDSYSISGSSVGYKASGDSISANITQAFLYEKSCEYGLLGGVMEVNFLSDSADYENGVIDFKSNDGPNNDGCNNTYTLTLEDGNGGSINVPLVFNGF